MSPYHKELFTKAEILIAKVKATELAYKPAPISDDDLTLAILNGIPFFNSLLKRTTGAFSASATLAKNAGKTSDTVLKAGQMTPIIGIALNTVDFIRIPLLYLATFVLGRKPPFTRLNNARWLYAAVALGFCVTALVMPGIAMIIGIAAAAFSVAGGVITLGRILYQYNQDKKALAANPAYKIERLAEQLNQACVDKNSLPIHQLSKEIEMLNVECLRYLGGLKALYNEKYILEEKIKVEAEVIDTIIEIAFSAAAVTGAVISLFFPPVGLSILAGVALAGFAYAIIQVVELYLTKDVPTSENSMKNNGLLITDNNPGSTLNIVASLSTNKRPRHEQQALQDHRVKPVYSHKTNVNKDDVNPEPTTPRSSRY